VELNTNKNIANGELDGGCAGFPSNGKQENTLAVSNVQIVAASNSVLLACVELVGTSTAGVSLPVGLLSISLTGGDTWLPVANVGEFVTNYGSGSCQVTCDTVSPFAYLSVACSAVSSNNTISLVVSTGPIYAEYPSGTAYKGENSIFSAFNVALPAANTAWNLRNDWTQQQRSGDVSAATFLNVAMRLSATNVTSFYSTTTNNELFSFQNNIGTMIATPAEPIGVAMDVSGQYVAYLSAKSDVYVSTDFGSTFAHVTQLVTDGSTFSAAGSRRVMVSSQTGTYLTFLLSDGSTSYVFQLTNPQSPPLGTWPALASDLTTASGVNSGIYAGQWVDISASPSGSTLCFASADTASGAAQECTTGTSTSGGITGSGASSVVTPYVYNFGAFPLTNPY
jgi:hypothetical protein